MALTLLILGAIGHVILWISLINRSHALGIKRIWVHVITLLCVIALPVLPVVVAAVVFNPLGWEILAARYVVVATWTYVALCAGFCVVSILQRWYLLRHPERDAKLVANHTTQAGLNDSARVLTAPGIPTLLAQLPGNQVLDIHIQQKEIVLPRLAPAHDGLRIAHLTDLHMSGRIKQEFFEEVVAKVNETQVDLVAITGDIVEGDKFLGWLAPTLGQLESRFGTFYVLGNHDRRATEAKLRKTLADAGLTNVGSTWRQLAINTTPLIIAGNELPWYKPAADLSDCATDSPTGRPTRLLLAHSPDQFKWAQVNDIDLMLAGHLHGGQVRLPLIGAITSPSIHGVRYAAGLFTAGDTVMHVSRGVSSLTPLRFSCPPEIAILTLRRG